MDSANGKVVTGDIKQFVNLTVSPQWVDQGDIPSIERLGQRIRVRVAFAVGGGHHFRAWLEPEGAPPGAHPMMLDAVSALLGTPLLKEFVTDPEGTKMVELDLPKNAVGGSRYRICAESREAQESGSVTGSAIIVVWRRVYFGWFSMISTKPVERTLSNAVMSAYRRVFIDMVEVPVPAPAGQLAFHETTELAVASRLAGLPENGFVEIEAAYASSNLQSYAPFFIAAVHLKRIESWGYVRTKIRNRRLRVDPIAKSIETRIRVNHAGLRLAQDPSLWIDGNAYYTSTTGVPSSPPAVGTPDGNRVCRVSVGPVEFDGGQVELDVLEHHPTAGGAGHKHYISIVDWQDQTELTVDQQTRALIHEFGHFFGLAKRSNPLFYDTFHVGNHCYSGLKRPPRSQVEVDAAAPTCVMFGDAANSASTFCNSCEESLRKQNLTVLRRMLNAY